VNVLITGAAGQLGVDLTRTFADHDVTGFDHRALDVSDRDQVHQTIASVQPDVVVHAAAWTAVDACESDPDRAMAVNALGTRYVQSACRVVGARLAYVSTDYVFDGTLDRPYHEWDETNPQSVYGRSKLGGEREVDPGGLIIRTSWVCSSHGSNMVRTVLSLAGEHPTLRFVDDQHGNPTFTPDLAEGIRRLVVGRHSGTFHVTNQGATTWFGLARDVLAAAGLDPQRVEPISTTQLDPPRPAPRPPNSVLDNAALHLGGLPMLPDHHESLDRCVKEVLAS